MIDVKNKIQTETSMQIRTKLATLVSDERGGEVIEYALILGLITVAAIGVIGKFGTRVLARWISANSSM